MANLVFADYGPGPENNLIMDPNDLSYYKTYILEQSAVPVMIAQSGYIHATGIVIGQLVPGVYSTTSVALSGTSGSVTVTLGAAILTGTAADVGRQITFFEPSAAAWRSALITAQGSTTTCTATLVSSTAGVGPFSLATNLGNPLPTNYTGGIWVYLPAGAVGGGSAGFYWCVATSTATANGILQVTTTYTATMGVPYIPRGTLVNAVGSGSNFTGVTSQQTLASVVVPGGAMGANGALRETLKITASNTSGNKSIFPTFGGTLVGSFGPMTNQLGATVQYLAQNTGITNSQLNSGDGFGVGQFGGFRRSNVDTSVTQQANFNGQITAAADFIVLEGFTLELLPKA